MTDAATGLDPHRARLRGAVDRGPLRYQPDDLVLLDPAGAALSPAAAPADRTVHIDHPPRRTTTESVARLLGRHRPGRLVAAGDGATLDVAKQAWLLAGTGAALVLAPLGAEPWRAFAPFTSLYEPDGQRVSRSDPSLRSARVVVDPALGRRPGLVTALHQADSAVHAVELLLNTRAGSWQRMLARAGLAALDRGRAGEDVIGAGLIVEGFASTGLGLAHAIASPLGARAGRTHDSVNVIVAPYVVRQWGERLDWSTVASALGTAATSAAVAGSLSARRDRAGLPSCLGAAGFRREEVLAVVPSVLRSSGIPWLPAPVTAAEVTELLERAWTGE